MEKGKRKNIVVKDFILRYKIVFTISSFIYTHFIGFNKIRGKIHNNIYFDNCFLKKCDVKIRGVNNKIFINKKSALFNCKISIKGNNNTIIIDEKVYAVKCEIYIEDDFNVVKIGKETHISGLTHLACIESCNIRIGEGCLFSSDVTFRTGDSHSILDLEGRRINPSHSIEIGDHVWIGNKTIITKGVMIPSNCILATGAIVTKRFEEENTIIGGIPAKIIKRDVNWNEARI